MSHTSGTADKTDIKEYFPKQCIASRKQYETLKSGLALLQHRGIYVREELFWCMNQKLRMNYPGSTVCPHQAGWSISGLKPSTPLRYNLNMRNGVTCLNIIVG